MDHLQRVRRGALVALHVVVRVAAGLLWAMAVLMTVLMLHGVAFGYGSTQGTAVQKTCWYSYSYSFLPSYYDAVTQVGACGVSADALFEGDRGPYNDYKTANDANYSYSTKTVAGCSGTTQVTCSWYAQKTNKVSGAVGSDAYFSITYKSNVRTTYECSGNAMEVVGGCVCKPGYVDPTGSGCQPAGCPAAGTVISGSEGKTYVSSETASAGFMGCFDGCLVSGAFGANSGGQHYVAGPLVHTGQQCNPSTQGGDYPGMGSAKSDPGTVATSCPAPQCPGTVNGTSVCVPCSSTTTGQVTKPSDSQNSGGTVETTTCTGGVCTTTTHTVNPDGTIGSPTGVTTGTGGANPNANGTGTGTGEETDQNSFCEDNPDAVICKNSNFGGSCGAFTCDGDAVQCAIAQEQHKRNCALFETSSRQSDLGTAALDGGDRPQGHPGNDALTTNIDFASTLDTSDALGGSCPAGRSLSVAGQEFTLITGAMCESLAMAGNLIVAVGALLSVFIVFRG
jgi:hypothetical protein